ncbi:MAG: undecaprenyl-diphosphate phosphatase [Acidobacteria bacterium]|nr:undecaprenyl-diphosphate phosphatase [Acidobacteriota bacterium]
MTYLFATLLGIAQGLTEFLPISSSAHLILARAFFGWDSAAFGLPFDVALHVGTLAAVLYYFRADLWPLMLATPAALTGGGGRYGRLVRLILVGTVPIVVFGLLAADIVEQRLRTPVVCAVTLAVGAIGMLVAERIRERTRDQDDIRPLEALAIGCGQAAALIPGFSRSGTTIAMAMFLGIRRDEGARFTFLMSMPAIVAAAGRTALEVRRTGAPVDAGVFLVGTAVAAVVGYVAVKYLIGYLVRHSLDVFAYYRLALAAAVGVWLVV